MFSAPDDGARKGNTSRVWRKRGRNGALALTTAVAMSLGATAVAPAAFAAPGDIVDIDVVTINDFHGRIEADGRSAGAAVITGAVNQFRADNPNTIFAGAGDLIGASTFTSFIQQDQPTIDALNLAGLDVSAAGNHEFDNGWEDLRDRVQTEADWEYISANVLLKGSGDHALAPAWVKDVDGVRVGFIGAVTEELESLVSPAGIADLEVAPIVDSVNAVAAELIANDEADVIILLVHEGAATTDVSSITPDSPLGKIVDGVTPEVDAIVSAHTHLAYNHVIEGRPVVSAGQYGENLGLMSLKVEKGATSHTLVDISYAQKPLTADGQPLYPADPTVEALVAQAKAEADVLGAESVGEITADFNRARQSDGSENRGGESTIGNYLADVHQWATGADIAFMNPGGIRANLAYLSGGADDPDGNVTYREAATVQPFANTLMTVELTGAEVVQVLEEQWQPEGASRPFLKLGVSQNLSYTYNPDAADGSHITEVLLDGSPLDPAAVYLVGANAFLAGGGDNFFTLGSGANARDTGLSDLAASVNWFEQHVTASPDYVQRSVGIVVNEPAAESGFAEGEEVVIDLSSLAFSAGEPQPTSVTVSLDGVVLASSAVDLEIVTASDEVGRATLTFPAPKGLTGVQNLLVETDVTGTTASVGVLFASAVDPGEGGADSGGGTADPGKPGDADSSGNVGSKGGSNGAQGSGNLASTGGSSNAALGVMAVLLLLIGAGAVTARGISRKRAREER